MRQILHLIWTISSKTSGTVLPKKLGNILVQTTQEDLMGDLWWQMKLEARNWGGFMEQSSSLYFWDTTSYTQASEMQALQTSTKCNTPQAAP